MPISFLSYWCIPLTGCYKMLSLCWTTIDILQLFQAQWLRGKLHFCKYSDAPENATTSEMENAAYGSFVKACSLHMSSVTSCRFLLAEAEQREPSCNQLWSEMHLGYSFKMVSHFNHSLELRETASLGFIVTGPVLNTWDLILVSPKSPSYWCHTTDHSGITLDLYRTDFYQANSV